MGRLEPYFYNRRIDYTIATAFLLTNLTQKNFQTFFMNGNL